MFLAPEEIKIGKRYRKDVDAGINILCRSIEQLGQLQPVIVDTNRNLIVGARRHRACELLSRDVWVEEVDGIDALAERLKAEQEENTCREPFTPSEAVAIGKAIEAVEKPKAVSRKKAGIKTTAITTPSGNLPDTKQDGTTPSESDADLGLPTGDTRDIVAAAVGMSATTYEHAKVVVDAASKPDAAPGVIEAAKKMDETGKVNPAYQIVKAATAVMPVVEDTSRDVFLTRWDGVLNSIATMARASASEPGADFKVIAMGLRALAKEIVNHK
jgi:ParB-like chromosome segregation protein Spo0J